MKTNLLFLISMLVSTLAFAKNIGNEGDSTYVMGLSVFYYNVGVENGGATGNSTNTIYDFKLGHANTKGLYLGGIYTVRSNNLAGGATAGGSEVGASIGYFGKSGIHVIGHYIFSATLGNGAGPEYTKGTGVQADFGYLASISANFFVGVDVVYRSIGYKEQGGIGLASPYKQTELFPMLSFTFTLL